METKKIFLAAERGWDGYQGSFYQDPQVFETFRGAFDYVVERTTKTVAGGWILKAEVFKVSPIGRREIGLEEIQAGKWEERWSTISFHFEKSGQWLTGGGYDIFRLEVK